MKTIKTKKSYNKKTVQKFLSYVPFGFVKGLGKPVPGEMCIEHALCLSMGLKNSDDPPCVDKDVREYKIGLNDLEWESNIIRAKTMAPLGIAQLGSDTLPNGEFKKQVFIETQKTIIYQSFDWIPEDKRIPEHNALKEFVLIESDIIKLKEKFKHNYTYYNYYNNYYNYYNYCNYYYYHYKQNLPKVLQLSVDVALKVLKDLKSPGCKYLYLLNQQ